MKNTFLLLLALTLSIAVKSQESPSYNQLEGKVLKEDKKTIVKQSIVITNEEADFFWPLYEEYNIKMNDLNTKYISLLMEYSEKQGELNFDQTMDLWEDTMDVRNKLLKLEKKYYKKMVQEMSPVKIVNYFNIERELRAKTEVELLNIIPETVASID